MDGLRLEDIHGFLSDGFPPGKSRREFSLVGSHVAIKRRELRSLEVFQPWSKQAKHGTTCLVLPSKPFVMDLTVHVDISSNPGPESSQEIYYHHHPEHYSSRSQQLITYSTEKRIVVIAVFFIGSSAFSTGFGLKVILSNVKMSNVCLSASNKRM